MNGLRTRLPIIMEGIDMKKRMVNILTWLCTFAFVCSAGSAVYFAKAEETEARK